MDEAAAGESSAGNPLTIAILLPCFNEAATIGPLVRGFRRALPHATIYVYDNNSTDGTALAAMLEGAEVRRERRQGKGHVVRRMFADIEADLYVMADGDGTYAPEDAEELIRTLLSERSDMVVGRRRGVQDDAGRQGHATGNRLFNMLYRMLFGPDFTDIFSGYRAFTRRYVKSFPAISGGFEIETEMSVHASRLKLPVSELELHYGRRPEGSFSKLSTFRDGFRILRMFAMLMKETRPFLFFGVISALLFAAGLALSAPVILDYLQTGLVPRMPTWMASLMLVSLSSVALTAGIILDSVARGRNEMLRLAYLNVPARSPGQAPAAQERPDHLPQPDSRTRAA
ncbi:glycosyltransferase [Rhizobium sp. SSA_523]|uniref:glycosyltransferase n=1 Tax=Rhizobium sp. SSA_523 TaxID=2952477 RepID=UPI002090BE70|nr:glycosyltransferase [Rhizobium sp. SSA_523]MCO5732741.1 glycosyltransferase [Rhizobium sp. SSA_523]WKC25791.1 glycosyltransferase [Rhizobium sp. SSA_523]